MQKKNETGSYKAIFPCNKPYFVVYFRCIPLKIASLFIRLYKDPLFWKLPQEHHLLINVVLDQVSEYRICGIMQINRHIAKYS